MQQKRWTLIPKTNLPTQELEEQLGLDKELVELLQQRGVTNYKEAETFFRPQMSQIHDPLLMKDMDKAVDRVFEAFEKEEKILVYGDYDVDGTTAVSLMYTFLIQHYKNVEFYIPDRYTEGYGVSYQGIDYAANNDFKLIIALDCGIKAVEKVDYAKEKGVDFIICDHHRPGEILPNAEAVLDPKRKDCDYPYKELCGCGVGFKLVQALNQELGFEFSDLEEYFDLLVVSIASDIVPVTGENRVLAFFGLMKINHSPRKGIAEIIKLSSRKGEMNITDVVFTIGPRINAAGRMKSGMNAVKLLVSGEDETARELGEFIESENKARKNFDQSITKEALDMIADNEDFLNAKSTVLYNEDWHKGVIGIVASRVIETHYKPTIILTESNGKAAGSARSVQGFDVYNAIDACSDLIEQFGGHMYAAGMTMPIENVDAFRKKFDEVVSETITEEQLVPEIKIDLEITLDKLIPKKGEKFPKFYRIIKRFAPFGPQNMHPVFMIKNVQAKYSKVVGETHLKLSVYQEANPAQLFDCIGFGLGEFFEKINKNQYFDMVFVIEENTWNGNTKLQLNLRDIKINS
ncbi:MAG: single-stranded-DNA-specific exonuclease RecJ [Flavobacteriales bacterium]